MSIIQSSWVPLGFRASEIDGNAKLSTVASTATSSTGSSRTASAIHSRVPARGVAVTSGCRRAARGSMVLDMVLTPGRRAVPHYYTDQLVQ